MDAVGGFVTLVSVNVAEPREGEGLRESLGVLVKDAVRDGVCVGVGAGVTVGVSDAVGGGVTVALLLAVGLRV